VVRQYFHRRLYIRHGGVHQLFLNPILRLAQQVKSIIHEETYLKSTLSLNLCEAFTNWEPHPVEPAREKSRACIDKINLAARVTRWICAIRASLASAEHG
jgi:hypothetical protein